jgi:hypothetical protein
MLACTLVACDQEGSTTPPTDTSTDTSVPDTAGDTTTPDTTEDTAVDTAVDTAPDTTPGTANVSGTVVRPYATCPPVAGGMGPLCLSFRTTCTDAASEGHGASVPNVNLMMPETPTTWETPDVPAGSWQLYAYLDDDDSGCDGTLTTGDFYSGDGCVAVDVTAGTDVTGVAINLTNKY